VMSWQGDDLHPKLNMPNYGGSMGLVVGDALLRLLVGGPSEEKKTLLIRMVQLGIDNYGLVAHGAEWGDVGGTIGVGRGVQIVVAGVFLNDNNLKNVAVDFPKRRVFQENAQSFYLTQAHRN